MLLEYYERTVGTPEKQPRCGLTLYTYALLEEYTNGGMDNEPVTASFGLSALTAKVPAFSSRGSPIKRSQKGKIV